MYVRKIITAVALLLVCLILLISASFAWLALARAPEITGIDTHVGANGSLEIALLSDRTYMDPLLIQTLVGGSAAVQEPTVSNLSWGNIVDLTHESYGLGKVTLLPSRLNLTSGEGNRSIVSSNMLSVPNYGLDGRFSSFNSDTVSAIYGRDKFTYYTEHQNYGVRAIGTLSNMTPQQAALAGARTAVRSYASAALSAAESVWTANGCDLLEICYQRYGNGLENFNNAHVAAIRDTATRMTGVLSYMDAALRQGIVGYAAASVEDVDTFKAVRSAVENSLLPLSTILESVSMDLPSDFMQWIDTVEHQKILMQRVVAGCDALQGDSHSWPRIRPLLEMLMDVNHIYLNDLPLSRAAAYENMEEDNILLIDPDGGVMADVANFAGDLDVFFNFQDKVSVQVQTLSAEDTPFLVRIAAALADLNAAAGNGSLKEANLEDIYGFAMDFAFRCNTESQLLLQTLPGDRVETDDEGTSIQGGGSYMEFTSDELTAEQIVMMMDAIRIAFLDNQNTVLGVAKLNTSNFSKTEEGVQAPLHLYDFAVSRDGSISMGERLDQDSPITTLPKSKATIITVVVWLDGDHVDNSFASVTAKTMSSILNLQFASSADLISSDIPIEPNV